MSSGFEVPFTTTSVHFALVGLLGLLRVINWKRKGLNRHVQIRETKMFVAFFFPFIWKMIMLKGGINFFFFTNRV